MAHWGKTSYKGPPSNTRVTIKLSAARLSKKECHMKNSIADRKERFYSKQLPISGTIL